MQNTSAEERLQRENGSEDPAPVTDKEQELEKAILNALPAIQKLLDQK